MILARDCPAAGHMIRVLYAFSWGDYPIFHSYPGRPLDKIGYTTDNEKVRQLTQYFHSYTRRDDFATKRYFNIYDIFLFAMRQADII